MTMSELLRELEYEGALSPETMGKTVELVTEDSRKAARGCVFVCVKGARFDGHSMARAALDAGALCVVAQKDTGLQNQILVKDSRAAYAMLCAAFFGYPARRLKLTGVTGTNGKTTTAWLLKEIFDAAGYQTGLIGTLANMVGQESFEAELTTPDPWELHSLFARMAGRGVTHCFMEVSSQALAQMRVAGITFQCAVFTNLTQDHLDYHGSFEAYREAKRMLFGQSEIAVVNIDDEAGPGMLEGSGARAATYSIFHNHADYTAKNVKLKPGGVLYEFVGKSMIGRVRFAVPGEFSVYNSLAAASAAVELGLELPRVLSALEMSAGVKGRMELVPVDRDFSVVIDYAHTPDGLDNVLRALRGATRGKLITVFGCGGDRDAAKRPVMGKIAAERSDIAVVTSDNPRTEDPEAIIADILSGVKSRANVIVQPGRAQAIHLALQKARPGDVVLLAGKGQETYQILGTQKIHMDEREIVKEYLKKIF
ncbi:MAG: UDP-N-acetylmuramoyl-L-alanyl-D-glutamate--2,6-diaminopimelate ligase [Oscillospiraceae bacterium]|nr:UDP-N-acetylmuramoyl-L-alanyl-D-glutamate--2,6-diaminopimelate ligase [Oscillospiraceae bacterium]